MSTYEDIQNYTLTSHWDGSDDAKIAEHLDLVGDVELSEPDYSFHILRVWVRKRDGMLLWATDSGCSCPSPFEDTKVSDLHESTRKTFTDAVMKALEDEYFGNSVAEIRRDIARILTEARKKGAR